MVWRIWTMAEATGWRFPPSVLLEEPEALLEDVLTVASIANRVREKLRK